MKFLLMKLMLQNNDNEDEKLISHLHFFYCINEDIKNKKLRTLYKKGGHPISNE